MEYGNPPSVLRRVAAVGLIIGGVLGVGVALTYGYTPGDWRFLLCLVLLPPVVLVICVAPTVLFRIRIDAGRVQQIFIGRYVLSDYAQDEFTRMGYAERGCAAVLHFSGGRRIHFFGAHIREIRRLAEDLRNPSNQAMQRTAGRSAF